MLASLKNIRRGTIPTTAVPASWLLHLDRLTYDWLLTMVSSTRKPKTTRGVFPTWKTRGSVLPNPGTKPKWTNTVVSGDVDLTAATQERLAFITPKGRVFKWNVMTFGVVKAPALFQELTNKILYILRRTPVSATNPHLL